MVDMEFLAAKNKNEVLSLLDKYGSKARPVAGGTDLMIGIREGRLPGGAHALIDISRIPELSYIKKRAHGCESVRAPPMHRLPPASWSFMSH